MISKKNVNNLYVILCSFLIVPIGPPQSLYGNFNDSHSIKVNWSEVASEERKGVITQYLVICMSMESVEMERQNVSANSEMTALFGGLDTYTLYNVTVAAYTKIGLGPSSSPVTVRTGADRPLFPPVNFIGYNTSSTSIYISWEDIPEEAWAGIIGDFRLIIQSLKEPNEITINDIVRDDFTAESFSYEATDLSIFTRYNISIACFNKKGISDFASIVVTTEESVAIMPPPNVRAIANKSNKIEVSWDLPLAENVPGIIRTYTIRLQAIYEAEDLRIGLGSTSTRRRRGMSCLVCCEDQYCKGLDFSM
ncbi:cell adhesion molecule DSCAML1-like [Hydractinia symbiolongicarpus]|uniref:cell adhesion molecule DSCAML1-like n=1 Tax=Hydractinia symbiolongicarpus TaxID=13093 RepID=UPI00254BD697|nr:cell adhesion molecule DSCAML1-like [Hydractinia symbiolongicarpus]